MPYMGHSKSTMHDEFVRHRKNAVLYRLFGMDDLYRTEIEFAAAFLEAAMTFPF